VKEMVLPAPRLGQQGNEDGLPLWAGARGAGAVSPGSAAEHAPPSHRHQPIEAGRPRPSRRLPPATVMVGWMAADAGDQVPDWRRERGQPQWVGSSRIAGPGQWIRAQHAEFLASSPRKAGRGAGTGRPRARCAPAKAALRLRRLGRGPKPNKAREKSSVLVDRERGERLFPPGPGAM